MSAFGLDVGYFKFFRFLNEVQSIPYWLTYMGILLYTGTWKQIAFAASISLLFALVVQRFLLSRRCAVPTDAAILLTGCSTGIGFASALSFASKGFHVYATVRKQEHFDKLVASAPASDRSRFECVILDVSKEGDARAAAEKVRASLGAKKLRLQSVINNAGYAESAPMELSEGIIERQFNTNVFGVVRVTNAFLPLLRETVMHRKSTTAPTVAVPPPSIINISSVVGRTTVPMLGPYCSSKYAVESITDAYRAEISPMGINIVAIEPGSISTEFTNTTKANTAHTDTLILDSQLEEGAKEYYAAANVEFTKSTAATSKANQPASVVADALLEAVLSSSPLTRYRAGIDANFIIPVVGSVPEAIITMAYGGMFKTPAGIAAMEPKKKTE